MIKHTNFLGLEASCEQPIRPIRGMGGVEASHHMNYKFRLYVELDSFALGIFTSGGRAPPDGFANPTLKTSTRIRQPDKHG
jgi:hypothetical protein